MYVPKDQQKFDSMLKVLEQAATPEELRHLSGWLTCDGTYDANDMIAVQQIVERRKGWSKPRTANGVE